MSPIDKAFRQFVQELASLDQGHSKMIDYGNGPEKVYFEISGGATSQQIQKAEAALRCILPPSFRSFLNRWNGVVLYRSKYRPGCKIFSADEMVNRNLIWLEHELLSEEREKNIVLFAEWNDGDYFVFDTSRSNQAGECPVLDGDHNFAPNRWKLICKSFEEWLVRFIEAQGRLFW